MDTDKPAGANAPCRRILLIYPPSRTQSHYSCPMGLLMLGGVLEQAGYAVTLLDANAVARRLSTPDIVAATRDIRPDVIGITMVTPLAREAYRLAKELRGCGAKLIAGGPHATLLPEEPLANGFDAVVVGEGEPTIAEAIEAVLGTRPFETVKGLVYRDNGGQVRRNEPREPIADLDSLPAPARHLVDPTIFGATPSLHAHIFTSRGCPARCAYCAGGLFGKKFRFRSADSVVDEMVEINREHGTQHFYFVDDAMAMDRERMTRICRRLIDERLAFTWNMMTRVDNMDDELLDLAYQAGCRQIDFGIESGDPDTLKRIHKPHTAEMVRRVIPMVRRHGICPVTFFILGFPWETPEKIDVTLDLMKALAPDVLFLPAIASLLIPFPGTEIYERYKDEYGFSEWWLGDDRNYDAPRNDTHPYYQTVMFQRGAVLDADFFRYSPEVKAKICDVVRFMYVSNLAQRNRLFRMAATLAVDVSRKLDALSPRLERALFAAPIKLRQTLKSLRGAGV